MKELIDMVIVIPILNYREEAKKTPTIEEMGGEQYPDLQSVQYIVLNTLAADLIPTIRDLMTKKV